MSVVDFRALIRQIILLELQGDGKESAGKVINVASGHCKTMEDYKDLCGYIRGLNTALAMVDAAYQQLYQPPGAPGPVGEEYG